MLLESLEAVSFRNLSGRLDLAPGLNVLTGENGQGKTNWLEATAVLSSATSFRTARLQEAINFEAESGSVRGRVRESPAIVRELGVEISGNAKTLTVNGKKEAANRYLGQLSAVVFTADELEIVRGTPDARRRFLDRGIVGLHPPFVQVLSDYNRVIRQKNALLQSAADQGLSVGATSERLQPWNEQLAALSGRIHRARVRFVERVNEVLEKQLFGREEVSVEYRSSLAKHGELNDYEGLITERLAHRVQAELASGHSLVGPHRDDLEITFDGRDLRKFGSAGQQRSALLLLLLANISVFYSTRGEYPLFLIDDIDAELDQRRVAQLLEFLDGRTQTIVTTSKNGFIESLGLGAKTAVIRAGTVEKDVD
jgi:DNA replication and repair protein RecF